MFLLHTYILYLQQVGFFPPFCTFHIVSILSSQIFVVGVDNHIILKLATVILAHGQGPK